MQSNVIDITKPLKDKKFIETFAKLWGLVEKQEEEIKKNPEPFLKRAGEDVIKYMNIIEEIRSIFCISPIHWDKDQVPMLTDPKQDAWEKLRKIEKIVWSDEATH